MRTDTIFFLFALIHILLIFLAKRLFRETEGTLAEIARENELLRREVAKTEKMKAVAMLASGMAHEIKNPLTAIKTFTEYLPDNLDDRQFLQKFSRIVGTEVNRINDLANQLLDFAKPSPLKLQKTNINRLLHDILDLLSSKFIQYRIKIVKDPSRNQKIYLTIDPNQLTQALLNIFLNSIEAMPRGGTLTVSVYLRPSNPKFLPLHKRARLYEATAERGVIICIQDTGRGIPKNDIPRVFDHFFSKKDNGTGLGLSITRGIISEHGGIIKIKSTVGIGTEITIELPRPWWDNPEKTA